MEEISYPGKDREKLGLAHHQAQRRLEVILIVEEELHVAVTPLASKR
jgi:hypothetical protein